MKKGLFCVVLVLCITLFSALTVADTISVTIDSPYGAFVDYEFSGGGLFNISTTSDAFTIERVEVGRNIADFSYARRLRILPNKTGKGKILLSANGRITSTVNVTVKESALEDDPDFKNLWYDNNEVQVWFEKCVYTNQNNALEISLHIVNESQFPIKLMLSRLEVNHKYVEITKQSKDWYYPWESEVIDAETEETVSILIKKCGVQDFSELKYAQIFMHINLNTLAYSLCEDDFSKYFSRFVESEN